MFLHVKEQYWQVFKNFNGLEEIIQCSIHIPRKHTNIYSVLQLDLIPNLRLYRNAKVSN